MRSAASRVIVTDLLDNTFYALIELANENGELVSMDARPSDAIALALRLDCPIYVRRSVLELSAASSPLESAPNARTGAEHRRLARFDRLRLRQAADAPTAANSTEVSGLNI